MSTLKDACIAQVQQALTDAGLLDVATEHLANDQRFTSDERKDQQVIIRHTLKDIGACAPFNVSVEIEHAPADASPGSAPNSTPRLNIDATFNQAKGRTL